MLASAQTRIIYPVTRVLRHCHIYKPVFFHILLPGRHNCSNSHKFEIATTRLVCVVLTTLNKFCSTFRKYSLGLSYIFCFQTTLAKNSL